MKDVQLLKTPLLATESINFVQAPGAGGTAVFIGTVRDHTSSRKILRLEFEAYDVMALAELDKIASHAHAHWDLCGISIHHRTGVLEIGEIAVVIATSAPHRQAAFDACQYAINTLKQTVPIWKKEVFEDGEIWVAAHP